MGKKRQLATVAKRRRTALAELADRYQLYQQAVQEVAADIDFVDTTFRQLRGRRGRTLREDFCGTAAAACEWVKRRRDNRAWAIDIDPEPLEWGARCNMPALGQGASQRVVLTRADVRKARVPAVDIVLAMNFSYWLFRERRTMRKYFRSVRRGLAEEGVFFLDAYGGYDAPRVITERRRLGEFTYEWEQASFNPITGEMTCHIHFAFPDRSRLERAFSYTWRLWTVPEIREMLEEAGFCRSTVYWQGWEPESGEADGVFKPAEVGQPDAGWICYLVAER